MNYIILFKTTEQALTRIKGAPKRIKEAKELFHRMGAQVKGFYLVMGRYDTVFIVEAAEDKTIAKCVLALRALGNVYSETLPAFDEAEFEQICANLP